MLFFKINIYLNYKIKITFIKDEKHIALLNKYKIKKKVDFGNIIKNGFF